MITPATDDSKTVEEKSTESVKPKTATRSGKESGWSKSKSVVKTKVGEPQKKPFKLVIRKLPVHDFNEDDFTASVSRILSQLDLGNSVAKSEIPKDAEKEKELIQIEHFIQGKMSRKRGPVSGAGFICIKEEEVLRKFIALCPSQFPFLEADEVNNQPVIEMAPNQRVLRAVEKVDKLVNTYEEDPEYKAFLVKLAQPEIKRQSAEIQYDNKVEAPIIDFKNIPMIKFLREKGEKKIADKKFLRRSQAVGSNVSTSGKGGKGAGSSGKGDRGNTGSGNAKSTGAGASGLKRTTMASSSSVNAKSPPTRAENNTGGGRGGPKGGKNHDSVLKTPAPAVSAPVDADLQEAIRRSVNSFREESVAAAATANAPNQDKVKMSRREKERDRFKKKNTTSVASTDSPGGTVDRVIPSSEAVRDNEGVKGDAGPVKDVGTKGGNNSGGKGHGGNKGGGGGGGGKEGGGGGGGGAGGKGGQSKSKRGPKDQSATNNDSTATGGKEDGRNRRGGKKSEKGTSAGVTPESAAPAGKSAPIQIMKRNEIAASAPPTV